MRFSFQICPFPQFDLQVRAMLTIRLKNIGDICEVFAQVRYFVKTLVGEARLPSAVDMEKDRQVNPVLLEIEKKNQYCSLRTGTSCLAKNKTILDFSGGDPIQEGSSWHAGQILPQDGNSTGGFHWKQPPHLNVCIAMNISLDKTMED